VKLCDVGGEMWQAVVRFFIGCEESGESRHQQHVCVFSRVSATPCKQDRSKAVTMMIGSMIRTGAEA
jgi:hypothetical protein